MKQVKFSFVFLLIATIVLSSTSCKKGDIGPTGPQGTAGADGPQGPQGATGTANVMYSSWAPAGSFDWADTTDFAVPYERAIWASASLTSAILDNGIVLVYLKEDATGTINHLPFNYYYGGTSSSTFQVHRSSPAEGKIVLMRASSVSGTFQSPVGIGNGFSYRHIIIPGGVTAARYSINWSNYAEVCKKFNIQP